MSPPDAPHSSLPTVPASAIRSRRRSLWGRVGIVAALGVALVGAGFPMRAHEQVLDRRGVETEATVVETDYERRLPDTAVVQYHVDGSKHEARLTVSSAGDFEVGQTITIEYDPEEPGHARPLEGWSPTYQSMWWYAAVMVPVAVVGAIVTRTRLGREVKAATSREVHPMYGAPYRRRRWPRSTHLVALWPEGSDRQAPPPLSVEVEAGIGVPGPVAVAGGARPGDAVVLQADGDTIWTTSKLKKGIDAKARPTKDRLLAHLRRV